LTLARLVGALLAYQAVLLTTSLALFFAVLLLPSAAQANLALLALGLAEGAALAAVLLIWRYIDGRSLATLGLQPRHAFERWLRGAAIAALMMGFIVFGWYSLLDGATWELNPDGLHAATVVVAGLLGFAIQGPAEEALFRGYVLENVRAQWGLRWGIAVSGVTFAVVHAANPAFGPLPFVNLVLFGIATALYRVKVDGGQLWGVFGIHAVWNWLQQVVFGLPNSGLTSAAGNTLFTVTPNTSLPEPISGGGFGPEGTLAASLALIALIGVALRRWPPRTARRWSS
jgi:uncharacterized protein